MFYFGSPALVEKAKYRLEKATKALDDIDAEKRAIDPTYPGRPKYNIYVRVFSSSATILLTRRLRTA